MDSIPLSTLLVALAILLVVSGLFSLAETAMMAANRVRLRHRAQRGSGGAKRALALLAQTDKLLGVLLLGNNLLNAAAATLTAVLAARLFGEARIVLALGTVAITFLILVFSEITPKVIGATHADRLAIPVAIVLTPLLRITYPVVWFVNLFVQVVLKILRIRPVDDTGSRLTQEEVRSLVLEGQYFRGKHRALLANLFDLETITVDDVMTPRNHIHGIDLAEKPSQLRQQLATSYHSRVPAFNDTLDDIVGILPLKQVVSLPPGDEVDAEALMPLLRPAYFVPAGTPLLTQLTQFQNDRQRLALVVDEYGELLGLVTIEDIIEEIIGDFTTAAPGAGDSWRREADGSVIVDGMVPLRVLNRRLSTRFPLDGPKTLNGLILEQLGDIPDAGLAFDLAGQRVEILQTEDRAVKVVRLAAPVATTT
ncbi:MAG TPA: CNNM domain-containing protein [Casimicrobiaceae bacterium]|jgi:Mg2+/Co2+ transporter CorB|nr:CNNM domain-containing protein [Casimicrobiaceae bacterium]